MKKKINVFFETDNKFLPNKKLVDKANQVLEKNSIEIFDINIILCNDDYIQQINKQYLNHDYPTDVISFNLEEENLTGEIYISVDTAKLQANQYKVSLTNELLRLTIHGILHLIGFDDDNEENKMKMTSLENMYLN